MKQSKVLLPFILALLFLTVCSLSIPFFWDSAFFSAAAVQFYDIGFNGFLAPEHLDTGGFPLYSTYLTFIWKVFGKSLAVSHFAIFPFIVGLIFEFHKLCRRYLDEKTTVWALILFIIEPVFLTQSILMGYDILVAYFFLLALNALYAERKMLFSVALLLLCFISIRGIMLAGALFIIDSLWIKKFDLKQTVKYLPAAILTIVWTLYHKQQTGWYIFSPYRENETEAFASVEMVFRQLVYIIWKNIDLGRLALWLILAFFTISFFKKQKPRESTELLTQLFITLLMSGIFMVLIFNPIGHKYFLTVFILLNIAVCYFIQQVPHKRSRLILFSLLIISLTAGNFIQYPQRYGNAWDSSLKVVPYFALEEKMRSYTLSQHIDNRRIGTQFPLTTSMRNSHLTVDDNIPYTDIETDEIAAYPFFLYSNIINTNRIKDIEAVRKNWIVVKKMESGMVELILYRNPDLSVW